jgi:hypothetical protein
MYRYLLMIGLWMVAFGTIWTAYESHVANIGVMAWQHEFGQAMQQPSGSPDNHAEPRDPSIHNF